MIWDHIRPGLRYEMDGTVFEITRCFEDGNVEVIDNFGMTSITTSDELLKAWFNQTACMVMWQVIMPKRCGKSLDHDTEQEFDGRGIGEITLADQGKEFIGNNIEQACAESGIDIQTDPKPKSWHKGYIERFFRKCLSGDLQRLKIARVSTAERAIQGRGVSLNSIMYNDDQLIPLRTGKNKKYRIKYDRGDLSHIFVLNDETGEYLNIPAVNQPAKRSD